MAFTIPPAAKLRSRSLLCRFASFRCISSETMQQLDNMADSG
jgi:hypothetical protein